MDNMPDSVTQDDMRDLGTLKNPIDLLFSDGEESDMMPSPHSPDAQKLQRTSTPPLRTSSGVASSFPPSKTKLTIDESEKNSLLSRLSEQWSEKAGTAAPINFVNKIDNSLPSLPPGFLYLERSYEDAPELPPEVYAQKCACKGGCVPIKDCRCQRDVHPYTEDGKVFADDRLIIDECTEECKCPDTCSYRVAQRPRTIPITVFKTLNKGWAVRSSISIAEGTVLGSYTGDLVSTDSANDLEKTEQDYCFDIDLSKEVFEKFEDYTPMTVNAYRKGNWTRFLSHSCDPNLDTIHVRYDKFTRIYPYIVFFAKTDIPAGAELTFDYRPGEENPVLKRCQCGSPNCRSPADAISYSQESIDAMLSPPSLPERFAEFLSSRKTSKVDGSAPEDSVAVEKVRPLQTAKKISSKKARRTTRPPPLEDDEDQAPLTSRALPFMTNHLSSGSNTIGSDQASMLSRNTKGSHSKPSYVPAKPTKPSLPNPLTSSTPAADIQSVVAKKPRKHPQSHLTQQGSITHGNHATNPSLIISSQDSVPSLANVTDTLNAAFASNNANANTNIPSWIALHEKDDSRSFTHGKTSTSVSRSPSPPSPPPSRRDHLLLSPLPLPQRTNSAQTAVAGEESLDQLPPTSSPLVSSMSKSPFSERTPSNVISFETEVKQGTLALLDIELTQMLIKHRVEQEKIRGAMDRRNLLAVESGKPERDLLAELGHVGATLVSASIIKISNPSNLGKRRREDSLLEQDLPGRKRTR